MKKREVTYYTADFETTVFDGQEFTEVWLAGYCEFWTEQPKIQKSLSDFMYSIFRENKNMILFFHNLKFDGSFILSWIKQQKGFKERTFFDDENHEHMDKEYKLKHKEYIYQISDKGVFYSITLRYKKYLITFLDSLKILPFSVQQIGQAFKTKHQKTTMDYIGERHANGFVSESEMDYFMNDLFVPKEALEIMFERGYNKTTIGSNCLSYFKDLYDKEQFNGYFPNLYELANNSSLDGESIGHIIHKSYHGAWCYVKEDKKDIIQYDGFTVDANSLYPSQMHSDSGNKYPYGLPTFFDEIQPFEKYTYQFIRFKCRFNLKKNYLPFIQIKGDLRYNSREMLKSNIVYSRLGEFVENPIITFTMTETDYVLFLEHYNITDFELLGVMQFRADYGFFDEYINHFMDMKINAENPVERTLAKLFLNNLYGKFAMYIDSSFKKCFLEEYILKFETVPEHDKTPGYIPIGSAITSYARNETIRKAQLNYDIFCYADTDSLHCVGDISELKGIPIHDKNLCCWKVEKKWKRAIFHRTKSYIETVLKDGQEDYEITCAGMGKNAKAILALALKYRDGNVDIEEVQKSGQYNKSDMSYIMDGKSLEDFKSGLTVPKNLKAKRIIGGIILVEQYFKLRG